ncbi:MAG: 30S ribosomal protein S18 [Holosporales bacterium]|jgi:small subunit ribosomal protein S18|nr:30S ribosomal protein S18 [Holosporales bacterium]
MTVEQENAGQEQKKVDVVDYKDVKYLSKFISEQGKIIPSRINSQPIKRQREISKAIKRARILALLPFVAR